MEDKQTISKKNLQTGNRFIYIIWGAILAFFIIIWYLSPLGMYPDSGSYMSMQAGREPVYPLFLAFFRRIFKEGDTLVWLAASGALDSEKAVKLLREWPALHVSTLVQSLLGAFSCIFLGKTVSEIMKLMGWVAVLIYACSLFPYVITPLFSSSHMVLGRAVLTEGLAFPLFGFFAAFFVRGIFSTSKSDKIRNYIISLFVLMILVLTRSQMLLYLPIWALVVFLDAFISGGRKNAIKGMGFALICCVIFFVGKNGINSIYTGLIHEGYSGASTGPYNMLTTLIYLGNDDTPSHIENGDLKELYMDMHNKAKERGLTIESAPSGILNGAYHYEDSYDIIGFEIQQPSMFDNVRKRGIPDGEALNVVIGMARELRKDLFIPLLGPYVANYFRNFISGLTRSVASSGFIMGLYALFIYLLAFILMVYLFRLKRRVPAFFMLVCLLMTFVNAAATALVIMCLSRYMIYNTPLFYMALICCIREVFLCHTKN